MTKHAASLEVCGSFADRNVCVLGLGFVGLTLATTMAEVGFNVSGVEIREEVLTSLQSGDPHFFEPGLSDSIKRVIKAGKLKVYENIPTDSPATVYIITVGTPLDANGKVNLDSITNIAKQIAENLQDGDLVILRSTVKLGTTRNIVKPILKLSEKKFNLAFCPERTIEGQAMRELRHLPQLIGADSIDTSIRVSQIFQFLTPTVVRVSDMETAEMIKLVDNTKRDVIFGYVNELAKMCNVVGLDAEEVITSGRLGYSRTELPIPGPVGGPCLSKDSYILAQSLAEYDIKPEIVLKAREVNESQAQEVGAYLRRVVDKVSGIPENCKISLLGLAFKGKPETDDVRGTPAKLILEALTENFAQARFYGFDPIANHHDIESIGLCPVSTLQEAVQEAHIVLILNNHHYFSSLKMAALYESMLRPAVIYDFWSTFAKNNRELIAEDDVYYIVLGSHRRSHPALEELQ